ncbi:hypothetical protein SAMN05421846_10132 [Chryseobacterium taeanense]|uniref:Uncharacterized protein n=1 Tax=Chryseobacterium taeanense TaxID=311334 RepID=A0A1G8D386_9FLAO|nr:hypothetical protein [Chryseobacterium taeanense]SDH52225.1 hypothetical protein SAMN05421846_10132 [Chryseobacterium taeanense]
MISKEQEKQITAYLISKKLSPQILSEVKDHFILQISSLMESENFNFQEAFLAVKISWKDELEMVKADFFSFKKVARIEKVILHQRFQKMTVISSLFSGTALLLILINYDLFTMLQICLLGGWLMLLVYNFVKKKMKFFNYVSMSFHPLLLRNMFIVMTLFILGNFFTTGNWEIIYFQITKFFSVYSLALQFQLLYLNLKKVNVLI